MGHSFGAFLLTEYLDDYAIDDIHKIIPMAGRLNMNQEVVDAFNTGYYAEFTDGISVSVDTEQAPQEEWGAMKLQAGIGYNRYVDSLETIDLTKLMYVYGTADEAVGSLLPDEIALLENTNATLLEVENGGHDSPFFNPQLVQILNFIRDEEQPTGIFENSPTQVRMFPTIVENKLNVVAQNAGVLKVTNLSGQLILQENCSVGSQTVQLGKLLSGCYIANYYTKDTRITQRLIVQ